MGNGTRVAQVLKVLTVCLLYLCPLREREGAASSPAGHVPERKRRDVNGRARAGEGVGHGTWVAQVLKVLMIRLLYLCPLREWEGAASVRLGTSRSEAEGRERTGAKRGKGRGLGSAPWRHSTIMINSYLIERPMGASERSERRTP